MTVRATNGLTAQLLGTDTATAGDIIATDDAPVIALCRELIAKGFDSEMPLDVYRGDRLALVVRSIGAPAQLTIKGKGNGFKHRTAVANAPSQRHRRAS